MSKFYLTTTLPYVNAKPHIGFALEIVQADIIARYRRLLGDEVIFNTGTDEHGVKIYRKALEEDKDPQAYVDEYADKFGQLRDVLDLTYTNFIRTTDPAHKAAAQEFWRRCAENGDIIKKTYQVKYCVGCELEKTDSELEDGHCPIHPNLEIELIEEENYFFAFSEYADKLLDLYKSRPDFVIPEFRLNEIRQFVERGLQDFSISRLKEKMPWGVAVPGDEAQVMYVWFDALVNYISTLGWPDEQSSFAGFWPGIQFAGKDNLRQQSAMWQAMLISAGVPTSKQIIVHGFITSNGQKMSKSFGNVVDPLSIVAEYGTDALRYWLSREITPFEDGDFTLAKFEEAYNANLANGLGNTTARILKMAAANDAWGELPTTHADPLFSLVGEALDKFEFAEAADHIWRAIGKLDEKIQETQPFKLVKTDPEAAKAVIAELVSGLYEVAKALEPFLPGTAQKIMLSIKARELPPILFPRKESNPAS